MHGISQGSDLVTQWRNAAGATNPAGPLFVGGEFAEADIAGDSNTITAGPVCNSGRCGTVCSGSSGRPCC